jgi:hypothetical protein
MIPADPSRDARAAQLAKHVGSWPKHTLRVAWASFEAGTVFRRATGSHGERYLVNAVACQCVDYQERGNICKHIRAVVLWEKRQEASPLVSRTTYDLLYKACWTPGCQDDPEPGEGGCWRHMNVSAF